MSIYMGAYFNNYISITFVIAKQYHTTKMIQKNIMERLFPIFKNLITTVCT